MRNRNPEIVKILREKPPRFQCKRCGERWAPSIRSDGRFARGAWQCPNGCRPEVEELPEGTRLLLEGFVRDLAEIQGDPELSKRTDDKMTAIQCRLVLKEMQERFAELATKGMTESAGKAESAEWLAIEKETSPLKRLERRVKYTRDLLRRIEQELRWIREKWGL